MTRYNDKLSAEDQIDMEETLAAMIFDDPDLDICETEAQEVAKKILLVVLAKFRPDLVDP